MNDDSTSYQLHTEDAFGHRSDRRVASAEAAATLIETWALQEDAALFAPRRPEEPAPRSGPVVVASQRPTSTALRFSSAVEGSVASDGSIWLGANMTGCVLLQGTCVGGRLRIAHDDDLSGRAGDGSELDRTDAEALVVAAVPLALGNLMITPLVGLGVGWTRTAVIPGADVDAVASNDYGVRVEGVVIGGLPIGHHLAAIGEIGASFNQPSSSSPAGLMTGASIVHPPAAQFRVALGCQFNP